MTRNVMITGATSGIGKAIAYAFASQGDRLIITGRRFSLLEEIQKDLEKTYNTQVSIYQLDVQKVDEVRSVCDQILSDHSTIDVLVNNAGLALGLDPFQDSSVTDMLTMVDTNVKGLMLVTRAILPSMIAKNSGYIINMGSTAGLYAYAGAAVYAATKSAVKVFSDGVRIDTMATNIKVTTIQPGIVETDFSQVRFHGDQERAAKVYEGIDALQAQDIAQHVVYVADQPTHVQITDMTIMATKQATGFLLHRDLEE